MLWIWVQTVWCLERFETELISAGQIISQLNFRMSWFFFITTRKYVNDSTFVWTVELRRSVFLYVMQREVHKEQQRIRELEMNSEQNRRVLKVKMDELSVMQRRLRSAGLPVAVTQTVYAWFLRDVICFLKINCCAHLMCMKFTGHVWYTVAK